MSCMRPVVAGGQRLPLMSRECTRLVKEGSTRRLTSRLAGQLAATVQTSRWPDDRTEPCEIPHPAPLLHQQSEWRWDLPRELGQRG